MTADTHKEELMNRAYQAGYDYEKRYGGCGQCTFAALQDTLDKHALEWDFVFQALTVHAGGISLQGDGSCGAYIGAAAFISSMFGRARDNFADPDKLRRRTEAMVDKLHEKFQKEYGSITCHPIHRAKYGRPFYIKDPDEYAKFEAAGAHDTGCTSVVGNAAMWTVEILVDDGLV